ncbi:MAG TPA: hypothetical protein VGO96_16085 [Pyrinomonadaceae bacterium]|jgi:hypothetical protein|nr:hypothetical protein [Pyrinomonadaceae bacterium]
MPDERDDEQAETFNQDQQEMFQNPDTSPGETRPRTPGAENFPPLTTPNATPAATDDEGSGAANNQSSEVS